MEDLKKGSNDKISRRDFMAGITVLGLTAVPTWGAPAIVYNLNKPNSKFNGVQIGAITYSFRSLPVDAESILKYCIESNVSAIELLGNTGEAFAGAPHTSTDARTSPPPSGPRPAPTADEVAEREQKAREIAAWRSSVSMDKFVQLRKMFADAGVAIYAWKPAAMGEKNSDAEVDYAMRSAKALGASHVTIELPKDPAQSLRLGKAAAHHKVGVGYHGHLQQTFTSWDQAISQSEYNGLNCDIGHYVAAGHDPIVLLNAKQSRIYSVHLKDRKSKENGGDNLPWGEGDTPLVQVLRFMRKNKVKFPGTVELEYPIPAASDAVKEVAACVEYCKRALEGT